MASISDAALLEGANHLGQSVTLLALVQSRLAMLSKLCRFEPVQHEEGTLDAPEFLQGEIELVLALEGSQTLEHRGWQHSPSFQRGDQAQDVVPMLADDIFFNAAADDWAEVTIGGRRIENGEFAIGKIAQPRAEPKAEHGAQDKHVI